MSQNYDDLKSQFGLVFQSPGFDHVDLKDLIVKKSQANNSIILVRIDAWINDDEKMYL